MTAGNSPAADPIRDATPLPSATPLPPRRPRAWQPLTPRGAAAFATAPTSRLGWILLLTAVLSAAAMIWFVRIGWIPVLEASIHQLPATGLIENQRLQSPRTSPAPLAAGKFLGISLDLANRTDRDPIPDLFVIFHQSDVRVYGIAGFGSLPLLYPPGWRIQFNRPDLESTWEAWRLFVLAALGGGVILGLLTSWIILASLYAPLLWLLTRLHKKRVRLIGAWRAAGAALVPGALLMMAAILLYGLGILNLIQLCSSFAVHLLPAWIYLFLMPSHFASPPPPAPTVNPFGDATSPAPTPKPEANPFRR